jgi:GNAT superfamily N-acetyltransferase
VRWDGCAAGEVRAVVGDCPETNGLFVWPQALRSQGIGTAFIRTAEDLARGRGVWRMGLGVVQHVADSCTFIVSTLSSSRA